MLSYKHIDKFMCYLITFRNFFFTFRCDCRDTHTWETINSNRFIMMHDFIGFLYYNNIIYNIYIVYNVYFVRLNFPQVLFNLS